MVCPKHDDAHGILEVCMMRARNNACLAMGGEPQGVLSSARQPGTHGSAIGNARKWRIGGNWRYQIFKFDIDIFRN